MQSADVIYRYPSYYLLNNIDKVPYEIANELSKWNAAYFRRDEIGYVFDPEKKELRIPRGYSEESLTNIFPDRPIVNKDGNEYDNVNIKLTNAPRDYVQDHTFAFMVGVEPYAYTRTRTQVYTDLDTGKGKTYLMIATACYFKSRMVVITPAITKVVNQWITSINEFTSLHRNEILHVKGSEMCADIMSGKYENVKVFVVPRSTLLAFVKKYENRWDMVGKLMDAMKVNIKAIDEAHMDFSTVVKIDCYTNVPKTFYMSSSPSRSEKTEKIIYSRVFRNVVRYGKKLVTKEQKHIIPLMLLFKSQPSEEQLKSIKTRYGPSLAKYGEYLLDPEGARDEFLDAYTFALYYLQKFRRNAGKILVLCVTVEFATELQKYTKSVFPNLTTGLFVGSGKDKEKELDNDIVFSTIKSMGTGSEFKNHQLTINTITYSSDVLADQIAGRIRAQENRKGIYCELINVAHKVAREHYLKRLPFLERKAKDGKVLSHTISDDDIDEMNKFFIRGLSYDANGLTKNKNNRIVIHRTKRHR